MSGWRLALAAHAQVVIGMEIQAHGGEPPRA